MRSVKQRKGSIESTNNNKVDIDPLSLFANEKEKEKEKEKENETNLVTNEYDEQEETQLYGMYDIPSIEDYFTLLSGERTLMKLPDLLIQYSPGRLIPGTLFMTTYRMAFLPSRAHLASLGALNPCIYSFLNVPLSCIEKIEREKKDPKNLGRTIIVTCKDVRQLKIFLQAKNSDPTCSDIALLSDSEIERALSAMCAYAFPNDIRLVFAYCHIFPPLNVPTLLPYDPMIEFQRMGVLDLNILGGANWWRITNINDKYRLCSSYSRFLVVPSKVTDEELFSVANFRAGARFPILSWLSKDNGASIWRSSQPKGGVSGSCAQDENYLDILAHSAVSRITPQGLVKTSGTPLLYILDCRPRTSAMANKAAGAGYESSANYPNTKLDFMNIGNIHVMRDSIRQLSALFTYPGNVTGSDVNFGKQIEETGWLTHVRLVLKCAWECARLVQKGIPVLVHCSHGWDRTSQVVALAQIMLDPYYRTFEGFRVLIEKEWLHAGHPFQIRCGHSYDRNSLPKEDDISPIFLQFLDCMFQLVNQFPHYFEYSTRYLLVIADNIYSCRFGNFLFNCEQERDNEAARTRWPDIFTYLHYNRAALCNPHYMDPLHEDTPTTNIFLPALSKILRNVCLWNDYFGRWSSIPTTVTPPESVLSHLTSDGIFKPPTYKQSQYEIEDEEVRQAINNSHDFDIPAMSTHFDAWEAVYRQERIFREKCQPDGPSVTEILTKELTDVIEKDNNNNNTNTQNHIPIQNNNSNSNGGGVVNINHKDIIDVVDVDDVITESVEVDITNVVCGGNLPITPITPREITGESFEINDDNHSPLKIIDETNSLTTIEEMQKHLRKQQQIIEKLSNYLVSNGYSVTDILSSLNNNNSVDILDETENDS